MSRCHCRRSRLAEPPNAPSLPTARGVSQALRRQGVKLVVAPYEADAQLAYLNRSGAVDVVLTEDSDCLPYGCKKVMIVMMVMFSVATGRTNDTA